VVRNPSIEAPHKPGRAFLLQHFPVIRILLRGTVRAAVLALPAASASATATTRMFLPVVEDQVVFMAVVFHGCVPDDGTAQAVSKIAAWARIGEIETRQSERGETGDVSVAIRGFHKSRAIMFRLLPGSKAFHSTMPD